jgi:hypothetical protein
VEGPSREGSVPAAREPEAAAAAGAGIGAHRSPAGPLARRDEAAAAEDTLVELLQQGLEITLDLQDGAGRFLLCCVNGTPLDASSHKPIRCCTADLVLPGQGLAVGPRPVECWQVPVRLLANAMARTADGHHLAPSARLWRQAIRRR